MSKLINVLVLNTMIFQVEALKKLKKKYSKCFAEKHVCEQMNFSQFFFTLGFLTQDSFVRCKQSHHIDPLTVMHYWIRIFSNAEEIHYTRDTLVRIC